MKHKKTIPMKFNNFTEAKNAIIVFFTWNFYKMCHDLKLKIMYLKVYNFKYSVSTL